MKPDENFVKQLKSYDSELSVEWCENGPGHTERRPRKVQRWRITRKAKDGRQRHIMFVIGENGVFQPLDNRVLEKLAACDSWRHGAGQNWGNVNRKEFMHSLGMKEDQTDQFNEALDEVAERRYHEQAEEVRDRLISLQRENMTVSGVSDRDITKMMKRAECAEAVNHAYATGKGDLVYDKDLDCARVVPGTS